MNIERYGEYVHNYCVITCIVISFSSVVIVIWALSGGVLSTVSVVAAVVLIGIGVCTLLKHMIISKIGNDNNVFYPGYGLGLRQHRNMFGNRESLRVPRRQLDGAMEIQRECPLRDQEAQYADLYLDMPQQQDFVRPDTPPPSYESSHFCKPIAVPPPPPYSAVVALPPPTSGAVPAVHVPRGADKDCAGANS